MQLAWTGGQQGVMEKHHEKAWPRGLLRASPLGRVGARVVTGPLQQLCESSWDNVIFLSEREN